MVTLRQSRVAGRTSVNGAQYTYDALQQRVQKTGGSNPTEVVYFGGKPIALLNPSTGAWTDLIWAGNNMLAEVAGNQTATPVYRLLDHEGSLVATTDNSGNATGSNLLAPYGQLMASSTSDPYLYADLFQDTEYGGHDAWYRNFSAEHVRWLTPDPTTAATTSTIPKASTAMPMSTTIRWDMLIPAGWLEQVFLLASEEAFANWIMVFKEYLLVVPCISTHVILLDRQLPTALY